jgi:hypothetical protein
MKELNIRNVINLEAALALLCDRFFYKSAKIDLQSLSHARQQLNVARVD